MKIPKTNTLTFQIGIVLAALFSLLTLLIVMTVKRSFEEKKFADEYTIKNEIIGHLNAATAWQAIERGCGATILGGGEGGSSPLFSTFLDMIERGDAEVLQAEEQIKRLLRVAGNETLERQFDKWHKGYEDLIRIRPKIAINNISKDEWLSTATRNINNEFDVRNIAFAPQKIDEKQLYLNNDLRINISRLCEYAGLERAIVGNIIASGKPFSQESSNEIGHYRSIVEQSLNQLLILKDLQTTSTRMKQAIEDFEKEFLQSFNIIREEVFASSREQQEEIRVSSDQITKRKVIFRNYLSGISNGLLNMSNQNSIKMLARALNGPEDTDHSEQLHMVENLFETFFFLYKFVENEEKGDYLLANKNGLYLHHPHGVKEPEMMKQRNKTHHNVRQDYPDVAEQILSGKKGSVRLGSGKMVVYEPFFLKIDNNPSDAGNGNNFWVIIKEVNAFEYPVDAFTWFGRATKAINTGLAISNIAVDEASAVMLEMNSTAKKNIVISFLAFVAGISLFVFFILWSRNRIIEPIKRLTGITQRISEGDYAFTFEVKRNDEIGLLAHNFNKMAKELTKANEDWELTFDSVEDIITLHDRDSRLIRFNNSLIASFNIKPEYIDDLKCYDFNHNKNGFLFLDRIRELSKNKQSITIELEEPSIGRVFIISSSPRYDSTGKYLGTVQITRDITERKCIEENLKREKEFIDIFVNNARDAIICIDAKGIVRVWNKMAEKVFGYSESEITGQPLTTIIPERYKHRHKEGIARFVRTGEYKIIGKTVEVFGKTKAGIEIPIAMSLSVQQNAEEGYIFSAIIRDMTENNKREDEIRKLLRAIEQSPASVVITDMKGDIEYVNKKFTQVTGYTGEEAIGQNPRVLKSGDKTSGEYKELWETITSGNEWRGEFSNKNKEGKIYWESASISPIKNSNGDITHFIAVKEDISAQKQMEKVQKRSHFRIREINKLQQFLFGPGRLEVKLKKITDSVVELFGADFCRIWVIRPGDRCESGCMHALVTDGPHVCRYRDRCLHLLSSSGRYTHIDGDVHRRVPFGCYKIGLVAAGKEHKFLINNVTHDPRIHNNEWASELGLEFFASYQLRPTGDETIGIMAFFSKQKISAEDDELLEMLSYSTSQAIQSSLTEKLLHDSMNKLELLFSSIPCVVIELTSDNKINRWNTFAERTFGIAASDILGQTFRESDILLDMDAITNVLALGKENDNSVWTDDGRYKRTDGSEGLLAITVNPIKNEEDKQTGQIILMKDVTEHKQMEQQLAQAQKLESMGQLAAGVAHEINTPAQFISDNTFFIQDAFSKLSPLLKKYSHLLEMNKAGPVTPEMIREMDGAAKGVKLDYLTEEIPLAISEAQDGIKRVTEIVKSMKTFSHPDVNEKVYVDINMMIKSTITVSRHEWKYVADLETNLASDLPPAPCYPGEFNQVILNLIVNAAHAIKEVSGKGSEDKGKITISTHSNEGRVEVRISDTGTGIPENKRSRIFEPFFTTKEVGKGTGQGLAIAHAVVVKKHKGTIRFDSEIGKGTTFIIVLPLSDQTTLN